jgi:glycerophosphoryl diester phosphodiesterase
VTKSASSHLSWYRSLTGSGFLNLLLAGVLSAAPDITCASAAARNCVVIGHRGASGYRPEHTLESYRLAVEQGADYVEPDLVVTRDGVLIARHDNWLSRSTDVASHAEFADRWTRRVIDGVPKDDWFVEDFTVEELQRLRAREPMPDIRPAGRQYDGRFTVPTFDEVVLLVRQLSVDSRRPIGLYPELKHPSYFRAKGLAVEEILAASLRRHGLDRRDSPVRVQSFEAGSLQRLAALVNVPLVQLIGPTPDMAASKAIDLDPAALARIRRYASAIGVAKQELLNTSAAAAAPDLGPGRKLVASAHAEGLDVHVFTLRAEPLFVPEVFRDRDGGDASGIEAEVAAYLGIGVDGIFIDQPDIGRRVCDARQRRVGTAPRPTVPSIQGVGQ